MLKCPPIHELQAYLDGELSAGLKLAMDHHFTHCESCRTQLAEVEAMSGLLASAATNEPKLSQIARHRLHRAVDDAMDQGLLRLGWGISGIAASVLVVGSLWLMKAQSTPEAAPPWVGVSAVAESADPAVHEAATTPAAEWYLADASTRTDDTP